MDSKQDLRSCYKSHDEQPIQDRIRGSADAVFFSKIYMPCVVMDLLCHTGLTLSYTEGALPISKALVYQKLFFFVLVSIALGRKIFGITSDATWVRNAQWLLCLQIGIKLVINPWIDPDGYWIWSMLSGCNLLIMLVCLTISVSQYIAHLFFIMYFAAIGYGLWLHWGIPIVITLGPQHLIPLKTHLLCAFSVVWIVCRGRREREELYRELLVSISNEKMASQAKTRFVSNISHDLRTPIHTQLGLLDLLKATSLTMSQRSYISILQSTCSHLVQVISNVLDFAKIENDNVEASQLPFDVYDVVQNVGDSYAYLAELKDIDLRIDLDVDLQYRKLIGDGRYVMQVLSNLMGNAIKFTDQGDITLFVKVLQQMPLDRTGCSMTEAANNSIKRRENMWLTKDTVFLSFQITDTGRGMTADFLKHRLFTPFQQETPADGLRQGTGLGLYISRRFVQAMHGDIWINSQVGVGTSIRFVIPCRVVPTPKVPSCGISKELVMKDDEESIFRTFLGSHLVIMLIPPTATDHAAHSSPPTSLENGLTNLDVPRCICTWTELADTIQSHCLDRSVVVMINGDFESLRRLVKWAHEHGKSDQGHRHCIAYVVFLCRVDHIASVESIASTSPFDITILTKPMTPLKVYDLFRSRFLGQRDKSDLSVSAPLKKTESPSTCSTQPNPSKPLSCCPTLCHSTTTSKTQHLNLSTRILVVEDNAVIRKVLCRLLSMRHLPHASAQHGQMAVQMCGDFVDDFDVVIMDIQMPVMGGFQACQLIRQLDVARQRRRRRYIVFVTAQASAQDIWQYKAVGGDDMLTKPVSFEKLYETLYRHCLTRTL